MEIVRLIEHLLKIGLILIKKVIEIRERAQELIDKYILLERIKWHCYASEIVVDAIASHLDLNDKLRLSWSVSALLHDLDVEITKNKKELHTLEMVKILSEKVLAKKLFKPLNYIMNILTLI